MGRTKKELGLDSMGIQKSMRLTDYLGDGIGQLPLNIMSSLVGQLTYFYTEKVGLAAGMVATMLLIAKIFDAFSDLAMGKIMDAGRSPKGKCRPWFSRMAIPALVAIILLFTVPKNIGSGFQAAYVLITNILITAIVYTAVAIPYGALMAIRTESFEERGKMGIFRTAFGYIAGMVIAILLIPITNMLGGTQSAWIKVAVVFGLISMLSLMILYKVSKENVQIVEKSEDDDVPFVEAIKMLFKNKYWVIMLVLQFLINISYSLTTSGGTYYAKYILGNDNIVALLGAVGLVPTFLGFILTGPLTSKFGMTKTCKVSCILGAAACLVRVFTPYSIATCIAGGVVTTFANIPIMRQFGYPVIFDATHSVQLPGGMGNTTGGQREFIPYLARAAAASGVDGFFMEVHDNPPEGLSDSTNMLYLSSLEGLLKDLIAINDVVKKDKEMGLVAGK